ncbi:MAG TPA: metallophosphoesterase family protein [Thermoleophilaceae bacterium]
MLIAVVSDTHLPRGARRIPDECLRHMAGADLILHAGDFVSLAALEQIESLGPPLVAVHGNVDSMDLRRRLPGEQTVDAAGVQIGMIHDAGPSRGRIERMRARFPDAAAVVYGHSHIPLHEESHGFQLFNPGSPTDRRRQPRHTMGLARVTDGRVEFELIALD